MSTNLEFQGYTRYVEVYDSSQISKMWYDPRFERLCIEFHHEGMKYEYAGVTPEEFGSLVAAESVGKYFNAVIRSKPTIRL